MIPIFIPIKSEDLPELDFNDGGQYIKTFIPMWVVCAFVCYYIIGMLRGFDSWGLIGVSTLIGMFSANLVTFILVTIYEERYRRKRDKD